MSETSLPAPPHEPRPWGLLAELDSVGALLEATAAVRAEGYTRFDAFAPFPVHGLDESMGIKMSSLPWVVAAFGAVGTGSALFLQWWTNGFDYRYLISAKPYFGLPAAIPITFELTVLFASLAAFFGLLAANRLPELYHPVLPAGRFRARATTDGFFIGVEASDPSFDPVETRRLLERLGAVRVETVEG